MPKMIRINDIHADDPLYVNTSYIKHVVLYLMDDTWKIFFHMIDEEHYCEWQEDEDERPLSEDRARARLSFILAQIEDRSNDALSIALSESYIC